MQAANDAERTDQLVDLPIGKTEVAALVADTVAANPRGAPITLPAPPCALDDAPINSRIVRLQWPGSPIFSELTTPNGSMALDDDLSNSLPLGADIQRTGPTTFVAIQRDPVEDHPPLVCETAEACIRAFKRHFHGARE